MKTAKILTLYLFIALLSCNQKEKDKIKPNKNINTKNNINKTSDNMDLKKTKDLINLQKKANYIDYRPDNPYTPSQIDLIELIPFVNSGLINAGYKVLSDAEFKNKVNSLIKDNKTKEYNNFTTLFANSLDRTSKTLDEHEFDFDLTDNQFIIKKYNFMIPMLFLDDVVKIKEDNTYSIILTQNIISRNKYLFNDSKADLTWLLAHDKDFLKTMLISLGYDKEPKINKLVLEEFYESFTEKQRIGNFFFTKTLNNNFEIREGLLEFVRSNTSVNDNRFIYALDDYSYGLYEKNMNGSYGSDNPQKLFNVIEKAHIVALIASIEVPATKKFKPENPELWNYTASAFYNLGVSHPEIFEIIRKQNYFGIKGMKSILESTALEIELHDEMNKDNLIN